MKKLIQGSLVTPLTAIRAQFRFSDGNSVYYGVITSTGVWYNYYYAPDVVYDFLLLPIPNNFMDLTEQEHIIYPKDGESKSYPFDEYKFSKITKAKLLDMFDQSHAVGGNIQLSGNLRDMGYPYIVVNPEGNFLVKDDQFETLTYKGNSVDDWYLIGLWSCDTLADIRLDGAQQLFFTFPYTAKQPLLCHIEYGEYKTILTVAHAKNLNNKDFKNLSFKITADEEGKLGKETIMNMREKLGNLKVFGEADVNTILNTVSTVAETVENVVEGASEIIENVKEAVMESKENVVETAEVPQENVTKTTEIPSKNVTEPTEITQKNVTAEVKEEENPLTIDSLRYEFTELKTSIATFDKHLREFAKAGSCSKKIQAELEKLRNENEKLREEVKKSAKAQEQLDKIQKYIATLQG